MEFSAQQIAALLGGELFGNANAMVSDVAPIEQAESKHLSFVTEEKYLPHLQNTKAGVVLITRSLVKDSSSLLLKGESEGACFILVENARGAMGQLLAMVSKAMFPAKKGIEQPSFISEGVAVPADAYVGAFAYIGRNVRLGEGVQIYPNVYIGDNVTIGKGSILYAGVKIYANCLVVVFRYIVFLILHSEYIFHNLFFQVNRCMVAAKSNFHSFILQRYISS